MGDVFDAMKRSRQEKGQPPPQPQNPETPLESTGDPQRGSLPVDEVREAALADRPVATGSARPIPDLPVAAARQRAQAEAEVRHAQAAALAPTPDRLNGYAPEIVVHHDRGSFITEQYRAIRTQILARGRNRRLQTHLVTSAAPSEGKTVSCLNLGLALSELRDQRVLVLEADLRQPAFHSYFGQEVRPGLLHFLRGETDDVAQTIHPTVYDNLHFLPAGGHEASHATELLASPRMAQLLDRLKDRFDHIILDTPPVVTVTDACILGAASDSVILVVRLNRTPSEMVERAKRLLRAANCEISGVILTHLRPDLSRYVYRYAYQGYYGKTK